MLTPITNPLAMARLTIGKIIADKPYYTNTSLTLVSLTVGKAKIQVTVTGWSPSLSRRQMTTRFEIAPRDGSTHEEIVSLVLCALQPQLDIQTNRQRMAKGLGLRVDTHKELDVTKLLIDRATAHLLASKAQDPGKFIAWHRRNVRLNGTTRAEAPADGHREIPLITIDTPEDSPAPILSCDLKIGRHNGTPTTLSNTHVSIQAPLPETLIAAAIGKRFGDIVDSGIDALDQRIITAAYVKDGHTHIDFEADYITVKEARTITPFDLFMRK